MYTSEALKINDFLKQSTETVVVDVRSPIEFEKGHIPGAFNVPLFENQERAEVGTIYKLQGKEDAIKRGLEIVSPKLTHYVNEVKALSKNKKALVYCFRGGMRSNSFAHLLNSHDIDSKILEGGYKNFRNNCIKTFNNPYSILILGGSTGTGKTEILHELKKLNQQILDLEGIANHKGSAFGAIGQNAQPTQQTFENNLFKDLSLLNKNDIIWIEDESFSIGSLRLPYNFWLQMKDAKMIRLNMPMELRVKRLVVDYGNSTIEQLRKPLLAIQKRLGGNYTQIAIQHLENGELDKVAEITLHYYDKAYEFGMAKRNIKNVSAIETKTLDAKENAQLILDYLKTHD